MPQADIVSDLQGPDDAPVLVLGNPIGTTRAIWDRQAVVLARHFRLLRLEWRGHGAPGAQSAAPPGPYAIAELGTDVLAALNFYGIERAAYAGVSLGGMTGLWLAASAPERITSLAVLCTALTPLPSPEAWRERARLVRESGMDAIAATAASRWFPRPFAERHPGEVEPVLDMLRGTAPEGYAGCGEAIASMDLLPLLPSVRVPTLVIAGSQDQAAPPSVGAATARAIAGSRLAVIRGAGHLAHYQVPGPVTDALKVHFLLSVTDIQRLGSSRGASIRSVRSWRACCHGPPGSPAVSMTTCSLVICCGATRWATRTNGRCWCTRRPGTTPSRAGAIPRCT